jgi:hypothetical protein
MKKYYFDTETCGFHGPVVIIQYAIDDEEPVIHEVWRTPITDTVLLIEEMMDNCIIAFNLAFDHFHLCQLYTCLRLYQERFPYEEYLDPEHYAEIEPDARDLGCLKPAECCDVMLHIRKGPYQSTMDRKNIYIRRVPVVMAPRVCAWLNETLPFEPLFFARQKNKGPVWRIQETKDQKFVNVYVSFAPSTALKPLVENIFKIKTVSYNVVGVPKQYAPLELGYAPYAQAVPKLTEWKGEGKAKFKGKWRGAWPAYIEYHIRHWGFRPTAKQYAGDDVKYTRMLYKHYGFVPGDDDSTLAAMVGAVRWRGFQVDLEGLKELRQIAIESKVIKDGKYKGQQVPTAPSSAYKYIAEVMDPIERLVLVESDLDDTTNKEALKEIMSWGTEASTRAKEIYEARRSQKEIELYDKLLLAGRFHASFKVLGTLSSRMAGADKLNPQGIKKTKLVRSKFPLAWDGQVLCGGDFSGFEVTIADAVYNDPELRDALLSYRECYRCHGTLHCIDHRKKSETYGQDVPCYECDCTGKVRTKIHGLFGTFVMPHLTYEAICESDGQAPDYYTICKSALFTWLFAGTEYSMYKRLGIPKEQGKAGIEEFGRRFKKVGETRSKTMEDYSPIYQAGGPGSAHEWRKHKTTVSTLFGFERYFTLEYNVLKAFYALTTNIPDEWRAIHVNVVRGDRVQTAVGAVQSALYGAMYSLQGQIARAAINTPIQGTGAEATKRVQRKIWDIQPSGYNKWLVQPINIHDEIMSPTDPKYVDRVAHVVDDTIQSLTTVVPLLEMEWNSGLASWADKKKKRVIQPPSSIN